MSPLPDYLRPGLDLVVVGINPGLRSETTGHHYAGPGNHFWPLLYECGLVSEPIAYADDARVVDWGIGLTNMVARASASVSDLSLEELRGGARTLEQKLLASVPLVVCFNGKRIYEVYAGQRCDFGAQTERIGASRVYVMPSTSARTAAYQRADKLLHFRALAKLVQRERRVAGSRVASR